MMTERSLCRAEKGLLQENRLQGRRLSGLMSYESKEVG